MAELTLTEARKLYESNKSARELLESKFSKSELVSESGEERFNRVWNEEILPKCKSVRYINRVSVRYIVLNGHSTIIPTSRLQVLDSDGQWVFDYDYSEKTKHFWYSFDRVYHILMSKVSYDIEWLQSCIQKWVENNLNLKDTIPMEVSDTYISVYNRIY